MNICECVLGMDIGGTNTRIGLVDRGLKVHELEIIPSKTIWIEDTVNELIKVIKDYILRHNSSYKVLRLAMGFPSVVNRTRTKLLSSTNFPGLDGVEIVSVLENAVGLPVEIDHDAYYLLAYDIYEAGIKNTGIMTGFYFGTGLGNAIYINGKPFYGKNGVASELGHIPVAKSNVLCSCGNTGCIEMYSCGKAFERIAEKYYSEDQIGTLFEKHSEDKVLLDFVEYISIAVSTEVNILDPDYVFLGGGLIQMNNFPRDFLVKRIIDHCRKPYPAEGLQILFQKENPQNGIIGAAIQAYQKL